ncbi:CLUMA_CG003638, isoform A [Clunio marinus]|uniref:CLUMA_CG003638, isoform A n=1 Tax=Clunio marinus TaxID=568069 RepID=A0A1J1HPL3_9DIPT|nr:CLUMA_CG003638, isoform A [Clunio marinus]
MEKFLINKLQNLFKGIDKKVSSLHEINYNRYGCFQSILDLDVNMISQIRIKHSKSPSILITET